MSQNEQEQAAEETGIPAGPGHQGGPPPTGGAGRRSKEADEAAAGHPDRIEPRAGRDS